MNVTQIYISDDQRPISEPLQSWTKTVQLCFADSTYSLYDNAMIEAFLRTHYGGEVIAAYQKLRPFSYKADLAKYCLLNIKGGWYIDVGFRWIAQVNIPENVRILAFRDIQRNSRTAWACASGAFYATPHHPALTRSIEIVLDHCQQNYYGVTPLCPTGPTVWGRALAEVGLDTGIAFGDFLELTPGYEQKNRALVLPNGAICAFHKNAPGGDLTTVGGTGTNNYNQFWYSKTVYTDQVISPQATE
jgi:hypothetical protein